MSLLNLKALALIQKQNARLEERPEPVLSSTQDIVVKLSSASMCGTDSQIYSGNIGTKFLPIIMGHEAGGVVEQVGNDVRGVEPGTRVLVDPNVIDGTCNLCRRGLTNLCENGGILGRDADGVFAEKLLLPFHSVYKVPSEIDENVIPLIQPLSTVVRGLERLPIMRGDLVLIIGLGATGLLFSRLAKLKGASVIGARRTWLDHMHPVASEFGVDYPVDLSTQDLANEVKEIAEKNREGKGADHVILTANAPELIQTCIDLARPGGNILQFFNYKAVASYEAYQLYKKEITLFATRSSVPSDFLSAIDLVAAGKVRLEKLITGNYSLDRANDAFAENENRKRNLKVIIKPNEI